MESKETSIRPVSNKDHKLILNDLNSENQKEIPRKSRYIIFFLLLSLNFTIAIDQGTLSGSTTEIQKYYNLNSYFLGLLGSFIFLGTSFGCLTSFILINKMNRKIYLIIMIILDSLSLFILLITKNNFILLFTRFIAGFCGSFLSIYTPVWSDQYGIYYQRALLMSVIHLGSPIGNLVGYALAKIILWKIVFYIEIFLLIFQCVFVFFVHDIYFSKTLFSKKRNKNLTENEKELDKTIFENIKNPINDNLITDIKILFSSKLFIIYNIALIIIFIIVSALQFWINDYMENVLLVSKKSNLTIFLIVMITAPSIGIFTGGLIGDKIGGYQSINALYFVFYSSIFSEIMSLIYPFTYNIIFFIIFFWIFLFIGSCILPIINGIIICSVDKKYNGSSNAASTFLYNVFGRFIGPFLYGVFRGLYGKNSKIPMIILLNLIILPLILFYLATKTGIKENYGTFVDENDIIDN
jgi:MFS family permease